MEAANKLLGVSVAVLLLALYVTVPGTKVLFGPNNSNVLVLIVVESIASLKVAVTLPPTLTFVAPLLGVVALTVGEVVSGVVLVVKTTSTQ